MKVKALEWNTAEGTIVLQVCKWKTALLQKSRML